LPGLVKNVVHKSLAGHGVLASVTGSATEENDFVFAHDRDRVTEASLWNFADHVESFDDLTAERSRALYRGSRSIVARSYREGVVA